MDSKLFAKVNEVIYSRLTVSAITNLLLAAALVLTLMIIYNRAEIVIDRPMFSMDKEMKYVRGEMTENVALVWAYNGAVLFTNINENSIDLINAVMYSFVDSKLSKKLKAAHQEQLVLMKEQGVDITFVPDGEMLYDPSTRSVTITGTRTITSIHKSANIKPTIQPYKVVVTMEMLDFRPWISDWKEGVVK
jgi:hypothetical protein